MVLELPIDVENPYRLYRKGYIDIATSWPMCGWYYYSQYAFLNTMAGNNSGTDVSLLK